MEAVTEPPMNGTSRSWLQWLVGVVLAILITVSLALGKTVIEHGELLAVQVQRQQTTEAVLTEFKTDLKEIRGSLSRIERRVNVAPNR